MEAACQNLLFCITAPPGNNPSFPHFGNKSSAETKNVFAMVLLNMKEPLSVFLSPSKHAVRPVKIVLCHLP